MAKKKKVQEQPTPQPQEPVKMGRPKLLTTEQQKKTFEQLMGIPFVSTEMVASFFEVSNNTLVRWIKDEYEMTFEDLRSQKQQGMKLRLAGKQYETAMKGSVPMQIWLGKQWLGQSDKIESKGTLETTMKVSEEELQKLKQQLLEEV